MNLKPGKTNEPNINDEITAKTVRLVAPDGEMIGIVELRDALAKAADAGLDLVEISPTAEPPVCKIMDYGKFKYESQKKANEAKKKQKVVNLKEIKIRATIDPHDFDIKMKQVEKFLDGGDKVKISMRFRGREMAFVEKGKARFEEVKIRMAEIARVDQDAKMEGNQMIMMLSSTK